MVSYRFEGYWKDVGTVQSLWEANMDIIDIPPKFDITDEKWSIYSRNTGLAAQYIGENAVIKQSTITQGCEIYGTVEHSVVFSNVHVGENSKVMDSVVMPDVHIGDNVTIKNAVIGSGAVIEDNAVIGINEDANSPYLSSMCAGGLVLIEGGATVKAGTDVPKGSMIEVE
jgi:glucose-1-phosphate adenylyltransferase